MKKAVSMMLAAVLTASLLAGCGSSGSEPAAESGGGAQNSSEAPAGGSSGGGAMAEGGGTTDGKYDLVFWVYSDAVLNDQGILFNQWVEEYCEENPNVNSITLIGKNDADLLTSLMALRPKVYTDVRL